MGHSQSRSKKGNTQNTDPVADDEDDRDYLRDERLPRRRASPFGSGILDPRLTSASVSGSCSVSESVSRDLRPDFLDRDYCHKRSRSVHVEVADIYCPKVVLRGPGDVEELAALAIVALENNDRLTSLDLSDNHFDDRLAQSIGDALQANQTLKYLFTNGDIVVSAFRGVEPQVVDLSDRPFLAMDAIMIAKMLAPSLSVTSLDLSGPNHIGPLGATAIADALRVNQRLTALTLGQNHIGAEGAIDIFDALLTNTTLEYLDLSRSSLGTRVSSPSDDAAFSPDTLESPVGVFIADVLRDNATLSTLILHGNSLKDRAGSKLAKALKFNTSLTLLDLSQNEFKGLTAQALGDSLKQNTTLTSLNLEHNRCDAGFRNLAASLRSNTGLLHLRIGSLWLSDSMGPLFAAALRTNNTLQSLCSLDKFDVRIAASITQILQSNQCMPLFRRALVTPSTPVHKYFFTSALYDESLVEDICEMIVDRSPPESNSNNVNGSIMKLRASRRTPL